MLHKIMTTWRFFLYIYIIKRREVRVIVGRGRTPIKMQKKDRSNAKKMQHKQGR